MNKLTYSFCLILFISLTCQAKADQGNISEYLVDISSSPISAGDLVGLSGSAITDIQSARDLSVAINPLNSGSGKGGFGLAITPARTSIPSIAISLRDYRENNIYRLLGATTLSYAENSSTITGVSYRKSAISVSTTYYFNPDEDAVIAAAIAFDGCNKNKAADHRVAEANFKLERAKQKIVDSATNKVEVAQATAEVAQATTEHDKATKESDDAWNVCLKNIKPHWNATKFSISLNSGSIKPEATAGSSQSLGKSLVISGTIGVGTDGGANITVRRTTGEVNLNTLATTPTFSNSSLVAIRYTQGVGNDSTLRILAEASNAKDNTTATATASNSVFKYAVGLDKKLSDGVWAEFRYGRKRTEDGTATQNASLLNLNWSPSSTLFSKK